MNILTLHFSTRNFVKIKKKYRLFILEINKDLFWMIKILAQRGKQPNPATPPIVK
jgi:hypothetical protein